MSRFAHEVGEQPDAVAGLIANERGPATELAQRIARRDPRFVVIAARGSSDNAARYAQYLFGSLLRLPVALAAPSLFTLGGPPPRVEGALVIGISQSGQSPDVVAVLAQARSQGALTVAVTNDTASPLGQTADHLIALHAGEEQSIAATKTYTASLAALALVAVSAVTDQDKRQRYLDALAAAPSLLGEAIDLARSAAAPVAQRWPAHDRAAIIGRSYHFATAHEIALKLKEVTQIGAEPYSPANFRHGPIAIVDGDYPVLAVATAGAPDPTTNSVMERLRQARANIVTIGAPDADIPSPAALHPWLAPLTTIVGGQLLVLALAARLGMDVDAPRGLRKITRTH